MKLKLFKILRTALALMGILAFFACSSDDEGNGGGGGGSLTVTAADGKTVLHAGETVQLSVTPADGTITWSSSKTSVGTVSETGLVSIKSLLPASVNLPYTLTITALNAATGAYGTIAFSVEQTWAEQVAIAEAAHKNISLSALNCNDGIDFDENGIVTSMAKEGVTTNTDDAYAYLVYPVEITKNSNITFSAIVNYSATSNSNGPALIMHNGISVTAYRALTDQGIKNILVDDSAKNDLLKTGGNGLTYNSGYSAADLLEKDVLAKVNVANGSITMSYNTADGSKLIANKANNFDTVFADGAKVYLAIGGKTTESMKARNITVTSDGTTYLVTEINSAGLAGLTISDTKIRVNLNGTGKIIANAVKVGGVATGVTVTSANESIATASAAAPNSDGESVITITGTGVGSTTVTITHDTETSLSRTVQVSVDDFNATDSYVSLDCYPASGMTDAYTDGWFRLTFDTAPSLFTGGAVMIYDDATDKLVDTILFADETLTVWTGVNAAVRDQLVYVDGNNLYFMAHYHALEYGKTYYVAIPKKAVGGTIGSTNFYDEGLSNVAKTWKFTTRAEPTLGDTITVDNKESNTSADFRTIYAAMYAVKDVETATTITVAAGTYTELDYYKGKSDITLVGPKGNDHGDTCVLTWNNYEKMNSGTHNRAQFYLNGSNLVLKNLSFVNKFRRSATEQEGQAECIYFAGGNDKKLVAYNCSFSSYQDTIQTTGRNWFYDCYIEGDVDFIWGTADAALFEKCQLHTLKDANRTNATADLLVPRVATLGATVIPKGYVVFNCTFEVDTGISQSLGRVAGTGNFYDQCAVINTNVTGAGLIDTFWNAGTAPVGLAKVGGVQHVGWKDYGVKVNGTAIDGSKRLSKDYCGTITDAVYSAEYSNRNVILNRVWNTSTSAYEASANGAWDLSGYYAEFGISE